MSDYSGTIDEIVESIIQVNPLQRSFLTASLEDLHDQESADLAHYVLRCNDAGIDNAYLADCYNLIVQDTLREQLYFQRHGHYRYAKFSEVADSVYFSDDYMRRYMHGLALTAYLWPNHRTIHRFFVETIPRSRPGRYLEVGPGHGVFFRSALVTTEYDSFKGVDISPTSVEMTKSILKAVTARTNAKVSIDCADFLEIELPANETFDAIVMGEVLEHVENPLAFLCKLRTLATHTTYLFVTTAINAPAIDHIYLYPSIESLEDMIAESGLNIVERLYVPYVGLSLEETLDQRMPINAALVLTS